MRRSGRVFGVACAAIVLACSGCWLVAGLEDRTLLGGDPRDTGIGDGRSATDGPPVGDGAVDGGDAKPLTCSVDAPFIAGGRRLNVVNQAPGAGSATLSGDEKEIIFGSRWDFAVDAGSDAGVMWRATRPSIDDDFGSVTRIIGANQGFAQGFMTRAANGGPLYYTSYSDPGITTADIYVSDPTSPTAFSPGIVVPDPVTTSDSENYVFLSANGDELFVGRTVAGTARFYLFTASPPGKVFDTPTELTSVTAAFDAGADFANPILSPDGTVLYFAVATAGTKRVTQMKRGAAKGGFEPKSVVDHAAINDAGQQYPLWASADNCRLYVARGPGTGVFEIFVYTRRPL